MGELGVLFNPGMRHEQEEKLAKQMLREDEGTGRKGRLRIDLESGVVVIGSSTQHTPRPSAGQDPNGSDDAADAPADSATAGRTPDAPAPRRTATPNRTEAAAKRAERTSRDMPTRKARRQGDAAAEPRRPVGKSHRRAR